MNKIMHKRIIGLLIFIFALVVITPKSVFAMTCDEAQSKLVQEAYDRYGVSLNYDNNKDRYLLSMSDATKGSAYFKSAGITNPKIKITKIQFFTQEGNSGKEYTGNQITEKLGTDTLAPGNVVKVSRNVFGGAVLDVFRVYFKPDGFTDPTLKSSCGDGTEFEMSIQITVEKGVTMGVQQPFKYELSGATSSYMAIDCNNSYPENSFEFNFCRDRAKAIEAETKLYEFDGNKLTYASKYSKDTKSGMIELTCDSKVTKANQGINSADYYTNKSYIRGIGTMEITAGNYSYHVETGTESSAAKCKVKCEEVVVAEYGPPIASKAGLCFEYKVKVTSRVSCSLEEAPTVPKEVVVCTPTPYCISKSATANTKAHNQGGPSEDFDKCVEKCDGGVYSDKCANKCYKQVYGKSTSISKTKVSGREVAYANKVYNENECIYTVNANGDIVWVVNGNSIYRNAGTCDSYWHRKNAWGIAGHNYNIYRSGIPATEVCQENCSWIPNNEGACGDPNYIHYLNHPEIYDMYHDGKSPYQKDIEENTKIYENLKKQCEAYATCNTTTAEFTISVDYNTKNSAEIKTINFPFTSKKDTIKYTNQDSTSCTIDNKDSTILSSAGCYDCDKATSQRFYQTEWSFPGSWIHNKTGELTFDSTKVTNKYWQEQTNKFCLPLNIKNVNEKWYNYYYATVYGNDKSISYNNTEYANNIVCPDGTKLTDISCGYQNTKLTKEDVQNIKYNINAITHKFGFFEWDINIKCFYAVNSEFPSTPDKECKPKCEPTKDKDEKKGTDDYRIKSVDLVNLFPDSDGNKLSSPDTTGRTTGYNWSKYANQDKKDPDYKSLPSNYTKWIQAKGYSVYSDDYLDYEINLTKDKINKLRKSDKNYTKWEGDVETDSVNHYISTELRSVLSDSKFPQTSALKCNNMKNYRSSECENFEGEVK